MYYEALLDILCRYYKKQLILIITALGYWLLAGDRIKKKMYIHQIDCRRNIDLLHILGISYNFCTKMKNCQLHQVF